MKNIVRKRAPRSPALLFLIALASPIIWLYRKIAEIIICAKWLLRIWLMTKSDLYWQRVNRNIGWITKQDQKLIRKAIVGIAGCGGMGGLVAVILARIGVGEIRIADNERFDISNLNRQYAASIRTLGLNKALATARLLGWIAPDTIIKVYPEGICEETAAEFVRGCTIICDEIEFWAVAPRILLHKTARTEKVPILCAPTVGHRVYIFSYTPTSMHIETVLGMTYEEACALTARIKNGTVTQKEIRHLMEIMLRYAAPELPEYSACPDRYSTVQELKSRLFNEQTASIIGTNPPMAAGFLSNHVLFFILRGSAVPRCFVEVPPMPGYLMFDAGLFITKRATEAWW